MGNKLKVCNSNLLSFHFVLKYFTLENSIGLSKFPWAACNNIIQNLRNQAFITIQSGIALNNYFYMYICQTYLFRHQLPLKSLLLQTLVARKSLWRRHLSRLLPRNREHGELFLARTCIIMNINQTVMIGTCSHDDMLLPSKFNEYVLSQWKQWSTLYIVNDFELPL